MGLVEDLSPKMTGKQRRHLRGLGHPLKPVVLVGQRGVNDNLIENLDDALTAHELVKVKVHDPEGVEEIATELAEKTASAMVQWLGKTLLFYREHPEEPRIKLPADS